MATRSRSSKPAAKKSASKAAPKRTTTRKSAPRKSAPRRSGSPPSQAPRIVAGLGLTLLGVFLGMLLWLGVDGSVVGERLTDGARIAFGAFAIFLPVILVGCGALVLQKSLNPTIRRRLAGVPLILLALLLALSNDETTGKAAEDAGGFIGGNVHRLLASFAGDAGVLLMILALATMGVVLVAGQRLSVLWSAFADTCVEVYTAIVERIDDASARRALRKEEEERQALIEQREAAKTRRSHTQPVDAVQEEIAFPDPIHDVWGADDAQADEPTFPPVEASEPAFAPEPTPLPDPTAEPSWEDPVQETPESQYDSGEPTIDLSAMDKPRRMHKDYKLPNATVLSQSQAAEVEQSALDRMGQTLVEALESFGVKSRVIGTVSGPRVTRYEIQLAPGTKVGRVSALKDDLAYALATTDIRILAPIPGKQAVGVEVPNSSPNLVTLGDIQGPFPAGSSPLTVWLGKDISGNHVHADLAKMPHVLVAGTTGSGKSGCLNAMLVSILLNASPDEVKMILIDPKRVELNHYEAIPHLLTPVVTNMKSAAAALMNVVGEMERRYEKLGAARSRNIVEFNKARIAAGRQDDTLPYVLVVIDELADLMMVAPAEVEDCIIRLAQKSRAVGIHLVLATQRPSVDVITGMIKANVPSRIAFAVSSMTDSRVILDTPGAESLLGQGDMLYRPIGTSRIQRIQGAFVGEEEVGLVVEQCRNQAEPEFEEGFLEMPQIVGGSGGGGDADDESNPDSDPLLEDALRVVCNHETASVSLLQRRLRVGYTRAGRLIDMLERRGAISGYEGSKPRQVLITEGDIPRLMGGGAAPVAAPPAGDDPPWEADDDV